MLQLREDYNEAQSALRRMEHKLDGAEHARDALRDQVHALRRASDLLTAQLAYVKDTGGVKHQAVADERQKLTRELKQLQHKHEALQEAHQTLVRTNAYQQNDINAMTAQHRECRRTLADSQRKYEALREQRLKWAMDRHARRHKWHTFF